MLCLRWCLIARGEAYLLLGDVGTEGNIDSDDDISPERSGVGDYRSERSGVGDYLSGRGVGDIRSTRKGVGELLSERGDVNSRS